MQFLRRKWAREQGYVLRKYLWAHSGNRIAVCFEYEWHDDRWVRPAASHDLRMQRLPLPRCTLLMRVRVAAARPLLGALAACRMQRPVVSRVRQRELGVQPGERCFSR